MRIKKLFWLTLCVIGLGALCSCDSSSTPDDNATSLPTQISDDLAKRCPGNTIEKTFTFTGSDFYGHSDSEKTYVYSVDKNKDEWLVIYTDRSWSRTIHTLKDVNTLNEAVRFRLFNDFQEDIKNGFSEIKEVSQNCINGKYYILRYVSDIPSAKNCEHTIVMGADGKVLKLTTYQLNNIDDVRPLASDIDWIAKHYDGASVAAYVNDMGNDDYITMHNGVVKNICFKSYGSERKWEKTEYDLPQGETVPTTVLDNLNASAPGFNYTQVTVTETPIGKSYTFIDGTSPERIGHIIWAHLDTQGL